MSMSQMVKGIVLAEDQGQDVSSLVATLANMPNVADIGSDGLPRPYGEDAIRALVDEGRQKARRALERDKRKRERKEREAALRRLSSEAEEFTLPLEKEGAEALRALQERAEEHGGRLVLDVTGENVTLSVSWPKKASAGGSGKPAADQPRPFVTLAGKRVLGSLTDWARENVPVDALALAKHDKGKLRGGKVLQTFLLSSHEDAEGRSHGPWLRRNGGEDFQAAYAAWKSERAN